ncbi:MAG: hypothetical protein ACJ0BW_01850 [Pontiellaceae bacterium]
MSKILKILIFFLIFSFYWNLSNSIENRTEAEDIYEYAMMVEIGESHPWYYHKHHLIFGPVMHNIYNFISLNIYEISSLDLMRCISSLAATGTLFLFFLFCFKRYSLRPISSALATLSFGIMYGFMRYSAEAEIPILATFIMMSSIYVLTNKKITFHTGFLGIVLSCFSCLIHIMNSIAVFIAIPIFLLLEKRFKFLYIYLICNIFFVIYAYQLTNESYQLLASSESLLTFINPSDFIKGGVAFLQSIISFDFVLGFSSVRTFLSELFANRMLQEEFYFGERLNRVHVISSLITFISLIIICIYGLIKSFNVWNTVLKDKEKLLSLTGRSSFILPIIFFIGYASLLLFIEPGNPELWVMGLMPFSLLLCGLIFVPLTYDNKLWVPFLAVIILLIHNTNAISALNDSDKDYNYQKSKDCLLIGKERDVIIIASNPVFERHLRYHSLANIIYLYNYPLNDILLHSNVKSAENIYILGDVFKQPISMKKRFPIKSNAIEIFSKEILHRCVLISENEFGGIYKFINKEIL